MSLPASFPAVAVLTAEFPSKPESQDVDMPFAGAMPCQKNELVQIFRV
jgi:hypothetical protein